MATKLCHLRGISFYIVYILVVRGSYLIQQARKYGSHVSCNSSRLQRCHLELVQTEQRLTRYIIHGIIYNIHIRKYSMFFSLELATSARHHIKEK